VAAAQGRRALKGDFRSRLAAGNARVAIVHDWLVTRGGSELVLDEIIKVFRRAHVFTLIDHRPMSLEDDVEAGAGRNLGGGQVTTSWMQHLPGIARHHRAWLPLMPLALRSLDVSAYDLVISNSHAVVKGVRTHSNQLHVCFCHSPMRYAWDLKEQYLREAGLDRGVKGALASAMLERMRLWDLAATPGVDAFAAPSRYIAERIERAYGRSAVVIHSPVDTEFFTPGDSAREDLYVTASRFVPYKRIDMIASAFRALPDRRLVIIGDGPDAQKVRAAAGPNVQLVGQVSREDVRSYLRRARAFVFAAEEDFGIVPLEAQACGTPVIAFGKGGVTETVRGLSASEPTGVFYGEQTAESLVDAVLRFDGLGSVITGKACRTNALRFRAELFRENFRLFVEDELQRA
jgi:glycosyltransferase involved in cell wall biosynthesis